MPILLAILLQNWFSSWTMTPENYQSMMTSSSYKIIGRRQQATTSSGSNIKSSERCSLLVISRCSGQLIDNLLEDVNNLKKHEYRSMMVHSYADCWTLMVLNVENFATPKYHSIHANTQLEEENMDPALQAGLWMPFLVQFAGQLFSCVETTEMQLRKSIKFGVCVCCRWYKPWAQVCWSGWHDMQDMRWYFWLLSELLFTCCGSSIKYSWHVDFW